MVKVLFSSHMRKVRAEQYFDKLLDSMYLYWNEGCVIICGDFNAQIAASLDYIKGVDMVPKHQYP